MAPALRWLLAGGALVAGVAGVTAIWVSASVLSGNPCSALAFLAAFDAWLLPRLTGAPAGVTRAAAAALATVATIVLSYWFIVATQLGFVFGLEPVASALRLGPVLADALIRRFLAPTDAWILGSAVVVAALAGFGRRR